MCGIAGVINFNTSKNYKENIVAMANAMDSRGPDDEGYLFYAQNNIAIFGGNSTGSLATNYSNYFPHQHITTYNKPAQIAFAHKRLSIIDLSKDGHQPMASSCGNFWITFNGEIYNFKEIRTVLSKKNYHFTTQTDTEVLIAAYQEWGEDCVQHFNGMFAFAILDVVKNQVFIARDRLGIKPFYYYENRGEFVFASSIKAIQDSGLYKTEINYEGLWQNFTYNIAQRPNTCFQNIVALEPGHFLTINLKEKTILNKEYWQIPCGQQDENMTLSQAKNLLEEELHQSIQYRLIADVELGTFMSGGIDSSIISSIAAQINPKVKAYTLAPIGNKEIDESNEAAIIAQKNNINHFVIHTDVESILNNMPEVVLGYEEPYHHLPVNYLIAKHVAQDGIKVALSGLGADELFAGYHFYSRVEEWLKLQKAQSLTSFIPKGLSAKSDKLKAIAKVQTISQFYTLHNSFFSEAELNEIFKNNYHQDDLLKELYQTKGLNFTDNIEALSFFNLKSYIGNHQLRTLDQFTMQNSLEGRFPFLDHNVVELAFKIPTHLKLRNKEGKFLLKEIAQKYIPQDILKMPKKGFTLPLDTWVKGKLKDTVSENISKLEQRQIFNAAGLKSIQKKGKAIQLWQLNMTELWLQMFIDNK